ncbi:hypothetical protein PAXRUDRAFT_38548, partial [Paxillus rubicundulus Ve08.2h10]
LISSALNTNSWSQLPFPSRDVVIIQLTGLYGKCMILNIYNNGKSPAILTLLATHLEDNIHQICPSSGNHMLWLGDFNCHHLMWEEERNAHLLTNRYLADTQPLIELLADYGMVMTLPKDLPTLESLATRNWTCPD